MKRTRLTFGRRRLRQLHLLGWFGWLLLALCSLLLSTGPRCSASWPVCTRRTVARGVQSIGLSGRCLRVVVHSPFEWLDHRCHCICRDSVLFVGRQPCLRGPMCCGSVCVAMSCGGGFTPGGAYDSIWDSIMPMTGNFSFISSFKLSSGVYACCIPGSAALRPLCAAGVFALRCRVVVTVSLLMVLTILHGTAYSRRREHTPSISSSTLDVECVCMLNDWFSSFDAFCPDNCNFSRFKLKASVAVTIGRCIFPVLMTSTMRTLGASACFMVGSAAVSDLHRQLQLLPGFS